MTHIIQCDCKSCGRSHSVERKSKRGNLPDYCPPCKAITAKENGRRGDKKRNLAVHQLAEHMTKRYLDFAVRSGSPEGQALLSQLYDEIRAGYQTHSRTFRNVFTGENPFDVSKAAKEKPAIRRLFAAFAKAHRGNTPAEIFNKHHKAGEAVRLEAQRILDAREAEYRATSPEQFEPLEFSAIAYLTEGFYDQTSPTVADGEVIDEADTAAMKQATSPSLLDTDDENGFLDQFGGDFGDDETPVQPVVVSTEEQEREKPAEVLAEVEEVEEDDLAEYEAAFADAWGAEPQTPVVTPKSTHVPQSPPPPKPYINLDFADDDLDVYLPAKSQLTGIYDSLAQGRRWQGGFQ